MAKLYCFLLLLVGYVLFSSSVHSQSYASLTDKAQQINRRSSIGLKKALALLEDKFAVSIIYDSGLIKESSVTKGDFLDSKDVKTALNLLLQNQGITFKEVRSNFFVLQKAQHSAPLESSKTVPLPTAESKNPLTDRQVLGASQTRISGKVIDAVDSAPISGVTIKVKGKSRGTATDPSGQFQIEANIGESIVLSYVGYLTKEVVIVDDRPLTIALEADGANDLAEVVVVGYGTQKKRDVTGAVGSLSGAAIQDIPMPTFENAIQGRIAGVQVQEPSGEPGAAPTIRVRGTGSISAGNEPLYVIDGFPVSKNVDQVVQGDVSRRTQAFRPPPANPLGTLNPNDIESFEILKDASAAAIYGSRGSNGVILITTKKGKRGADKPTIGFNAYGGMQSVARRISLMNASQYATYSMEAKNNAYLQDVAGANANDPNSVRYTRTTNGSYFLPDDFVNPTGTDTDWQDVIFRTAPIQSYNLSLSGGSDKTNYYVSGEYFSQEGIVETSKFDRYSFRASMDATPIAKLKVGFNVNPSFTNTGRASASAPYFADPPGAIYAAIVHSPTVSPYLPDGSINQSDNQSHLFTEDGRGAAMTASSNPLAILRHIHDDLRQFRTFGNVYGEYELLPNLKYKLYTGIDVNTYNRSFYRENAFLDRTATVGEPYGQSNSSLNTNWLVENTLSYEKLFGKDHFLSAIAGYSAQKDDLNTNQLFAERFPDDLVQTLSGGQVTGGSSNREQWSLVSMLARANYSFKDRYLLTATVRSDRSSRFGEGNKTGIFPSFSLGWRVSDEPFMENVQFINDMKIRASWGKTGNFLIPNYAAIGLLNPYNYVFGNTVVNGIAPLTPSNPGLTWEKNAQTDIGLELTLFNNRVATTIDVYRKITSDLLLNVQVPGAVGYGTQNPLQNIGEVENKGIELAFTTYNLTGEFRWNTDLNFSANKNEVLKLGDSGDPILSVGGAGIRHITQIGHPIGSYYGHVVEGIYQSQAEIDAAPNDLLAPAARPGDFRFKDVNEDGVIDADDRTVTGNYQPDFIWGITNNFEYKGFGLNFLVQGVQGSDVLNLTRRHMGNGEGNTNSYRLWTERWVSPEQPGNGEIPRADRLTDTHGNNNRPSSFQVEDASYIRLRTATISYNIPNKKLGSTIKSARVYVSGTNLFTISDYIGFNPEVNNQSTVTNVQGEDYGAYPLQRTFTLGVNVSF